MHEHTDLLQKNVSNWRAAHDLFAPQPVRNASIFLMRLVLHDWPFDDARKILKHLRAAATPDTVLVILDHILPYACAAGDAEDADAAPPPLLSNYGAANSLGYGTDVLVRGHSSSS
jgi:hypothetical protein